MLDGVESHFNAVNTKLLTELDIDLTGVIDECLMMGAVSALS